MNNKYIRFILILCLINVAFIISKVAIMKSLEAEQALVAVTQVIENSNGFQNLSVQSSIKNNFELIINVLALLFNGGMLVKAICIAYSDFQDRRKK